MDCADQHSILEDSMKFIRIEMLFFVWIVPILGLIWYYGMRRRGALLSHFSTPRGLESITPETSQKRRWTKAALVMSAFLFTVLALTGPQYGYRWEEIERKGIDIIIALDCSRSMLATDIAPSRLDRAKREVFDLLHMLKGDRVGLVAFAGTAFLQCPLTQDYEAFNLFLNSLTPDYLPVGGTDLQGAVQVAFSGFNAEDNSEKAIILITDGESTSGNPVKAATTAGEGGVKLFCIGVGKDTGVPVPGAEGTFAKDRTGKIVVTRLDEETLKKMAVVTGGAYVRSVAGDMDLDAIYEQEIRGKMEASTLSSGRKQVWEDRYQWILIFAVIALAIELFISAVRKKHAITLILIGMLLFPATKHASAAGARESVKNGLDAYEAGDYETALKQFIDAQLETPDRPEIYYNIANTYYRLGDFESALQNYREALKTEDPALRQKSLYNSGNTNYRLQRFEKAIENYEAAMQLDETDDQARRNIEFVKKMMELQKQQQPQEGGNSDNKDNSDEQDGRSQTRQGDGQQGEKPESGESGNAPSQSQENSQSPTYGDQMKPDGQDSAGQGASSEKKENDGGRQSPAESDAKETDSPPTAAPAEPQAGNDENDTGSQAQRMLNRLKDQPGRAMMPTYQKRVIEKDW